jgi:hypothetical protein
MNGIAVLISLAAVGVDYGWQPGVDGQLEYIIQIEPSLLNSMQSGREIVSEIQPEARNVRRFRVRVGTGALPRVGGTAVGAAPARMSTSDVADPYGTNRGASSVGMLDLPPPPLLFGPDGKASVLVRPGDRALPGIVPPANAYAPAGNPAAPEYGAGGLGAPPVLPLNEYSGGSGWQPPGTPAAPTGALGPPPSDGSGFQTQPSNFWQGGSPNGFGNPAPVSPVPGPGPETGFPSPIRSSNTKPKNQSLIEKMVAKSRAVQEGSDTASQLADNRSDAAAQKPTLDAETAERLKRLQAEHPWVPLVLTSLALFGSLAANAYLGWVAVGIYHRYREMCEQLHEAQASLT